MHAKATESQKNLQNTQMQDHCRLNGVSTVNTIDTLYIVKFPLVYNDYVCILRLMSVTY